jgi:hypothetical protein
VLLYLPAAAAAAAVTTAKRLTGLIASWLCIGRQPISPKVAAALQAFVEHHPQVRAAEYLCAQI